ncbi:glycosyltransferase family 2 protein [uncultured Vagococcus sp.]|uniref:glycosyltransferase family 2 protein n=1 Tax=uncultured Vagococcus sp. TaxID=189676 RepID=UPI0028D15078|nr:glycosyltransferase family 2 protein [uncultured Vagococcus sp.]
MKQPFFSIIVPVYNAESSIATLISEIKEISGVDFECILINDGSVDNTEAIILESIKTDQRFSTKTIPNNGPGNARNEGLSLANGEYFIFIDADDKFSSTSLVDYCHLIQDNRDVDLIISSFVIHTMQKGSVINKKDYIIEDKKYQSHNEFIEGVYGLMNRQLLYVCWNKCYRLDIVRDYGISFNSYNSCEDRLFNIAYYHHCSRVITTRKVTYHYYFDGAEGITNKYHDNKFETFKEFYLKTNDLTSNLNKDGTASLYLKGVTSVVFSIHSEKKLSNKEKRKLIKTISKDATVIEAKKISRTESTTKKVTKFIFRCPYPLLYGATYVGSLVERKLPGVIALLKRKY